MVKRFLRFPLKIRIQSILGLIQERRALRAKISSCVDADFLENFGFCAYPSGIKYHSDVALPLILCLYLRTEEVCLPFSLILELVTALIRF